MSLPTPWMISGHSCSVGNRPLPMIPYPGITKVGSVMFSVLGDNCKSSNLHRSVELRDWRSGA
eukprot:5766738-Amphidinium_carterae.1